MKSVFRFLAVGLFAAASAGAAYAQDPCADIEGQQAIYKRFTDTFDKDIPTRETAVTAAKEYIEKYGACADAKAQVDYLKNYIPPTEKAIQDYKRDKQKGELFTRFNTAMDAKNWDEVYASGKEIIAVEGDSQIGNEVALVLGSIGLDESYKNNDKYNADTVRYAQMGIEKLQSGKSFKTYGVATKNTNYSYANKNFPDTKANALGWMNFTIGYIKYYRDKDKKGALPYLYAASQANSFVKNKPEIYVAIGQHYLDEVVRLESQRTELFKASNNAETDETKALLALQKGYAERGFDAYARAYKLVGTTPAEKATRDSIYARLKAAYELRNGNTTGLDAYISSVTARPMPNPATEVTPIVDTPAAAPTTNSSTTTTTPAVNAATATKPAASTVNPTATANKPTAAPAKKPAPKKKGTR
jgi:hypothetical protein